MKNLKEHITEAWAGVKKYTNNAEIEAWCDEMGIKNYTINSKGHIDVEGGVDLGGENFKELPYKFGRVKGFFDIGSNKNLTSLKNCPDKVGGQFSCSGCSALESLEGCPKKVGSKFYCRKCKRQFTEEDVEKVCKVRGKIGV